jgi:hypothetical protein
MNQNQAFRVLSKTMIFGTIPYRSKVCKCCDSSGVSRLGKTCRSCRGEGGLYTMLSVESSDKILRGAGFKIRENKNNFSVVTLGGKKSDVKFDLSKVAIEERTVAGNVAVAQLYQYSNRMVLDAYRG